MNWPDLADDLPAPRDDEPSSLRHDIADELADHLHSSFVRELHRTPEETSAKQHVLDRFGDPRRVARQLWFDAMKEKLMSQRLMLTALLVTAVACLGSTGLSWMLVQQSREANQALLEQAKEARALNRELLTQNETANSKMLDRLAALAASASAAPPKSMEWNPVKIRLVKDKAGGPPAEGYEVRLSGNLLDTAKQIEVVRKTGADGMADMGLLRPGRHEIRISTPWAESRETLQLTVLPGHDLVEEIVCPAADREVAPVSMSFDWPQDLQNQKLWTILQCYQEPREIGKTSWREAGILKFAVFDSEGHVASQPIDRQPVNPNTQSLDFNVARGTNRTAFAGLFFDEHKLAPWQYPQQPSFPRSKLLEKEAKEAHELRPFYFSLLGAPARAEWRLPVGHYIVTVLIVAEKPHEAADDGLLKVGVLGGLIGNYHPQLPNLNQTDGFVVPFSDWLEKNFDRETSVGPRERWVAVKAAQPQFEIVTGSDNRVRLPMYARLIENVREFLEFTK